MILPSAVVHCSSVRVRILADDLAGYLRDCCANSAARVGKTSLCARKAAVWNLENLLALVEGHSLRTFSADRQWENEVAVLVRSIDLGSLCSGLEVRDGETTAVACDYAVACDFEPACASRAAISAATLFQSSLPVLGQMAAHRLLSVQPPAASIASMYPFVPTNHPCPYSAALAFVVATETYVNHACSTFLYPLCFCLFFFLLLYLNLSLELKFSAFSLPLQSFLLSFSLKLHRSGSFGGGLATALTSRRSSSSFLTVSMSSSLDSLAN